MNEIAFEHGTGCHVTPITKMVSQDRLSRASTAFLLIGGMECPTCALRVRNGFLQIEGVLAADVVLSSAIAKVWFDANVVQPDVLVSGLPAFTEDGRHYYSADILEVFSPPKGVENEIFE